MRILSAAKQTTLIDLKRPSVYPVAALFVLFAISGCAGKDAQMWAKDKPALLGSVQQTQAENAEMRQRIELMEQRILDLEATVKQQEADNAALTATVNSLSKNSRKGKSATPAVEKEQKLVRKLEKIESSIRSAAGGGAPVIQPSDKSIEKNSYTAAYLALKSGRYEEASTAFKALLKEHPKGEYADQAWFWLGESNYAQNKIKESIAAFKKVTNDYPESAKHAAAMLKLAEAYQSTGRRGEAKAVLQLLIQQHTETNAAEQARDKLKALDAEPKK